MTLPAICKAVLKIALWHTYSIAVFLHECFCTSPIQALARELLKYWMSVKENRRWQRQISQPSKMTAEEEKKITIGQGML